MDETSLSFHLASTWWQRLRGLLGTDEQAGCLLLTSCNSIHTFGMSYAIDVAFIARDGKVLLSEREVVPGRLVSQGAAASVLERPHDDSWWPSAGTVLSFLASDEANV